MKLFSLPVFLFLYVVSASTLGQENSTDSWSDQQREILVHLDFLDLTNISSVEQSFTANLYYELTWQDDSLKHDGPGSIYRNLDEIWDPHLQFLNQQNGKETLPREAEVFPSGNIVYRQRVWGVFSQSFDLANFPFDQQSVRITMLPAGFSAEKVLLVFQESTGVESNLTIPDWSVIDWHIESEVVGIGKSSISMSKATLQIDLQRHSRFFLVKILLPLSLIVMMSWTIFWLSPEHAGPQISVSVTAMLTLIAFQFSMTSMLPPLSKLTLLDWFVSCITFLVFFSLLESIYTARMASAGQLEKALRADRYSRWAFPALFVLSAVSSFFLIK